MPSEIEVPLPDWELEPDPLGAYRQGLDAERRYLDALEAAVAPLAAAGGDDDAAVAAAARIDDPRLAAWPPMAGKHADNARGLLAALRRGPAPAAEASGSG